MAYTLHLTPTSLSTLEMPYKDKNFQIDFDFINHKLKVITSDGELRDFDLYGNSVADFYHKIFVVLGDLKIDLKINSTPVEMENPIPFEKDTKNATYDKAQAAALHQALLKMQNGLTQMRCDYKENAVRCIFSGIVSIWQYLAFQDERHHHIREASLTFLIG